MGTKDVKDVLGTEVNDLVPLDLYVETEESISEECSADLEVKFIVETFVDKYVMFSEE